MLAIANKAKSPKKNSAPVKSSEIRDPFYSEENSARLQKSIRQLENGQVVNIALEDLRKMING